MAKYINVRAAIAIKPVSMNFSSTIWDIFILKRLAVKY